MASEGSWGIRKQPVAYWGKEQAMAVWRERLFTFLVRNSAQPAVASGFPPQWVVEVLIQPSF
jgi:hypothetical protein